MDLLTAEGDYYLANTMIAKLLEENHRGIEFAEKDYERWYNGSRRTRLPIVVVAVKSTLSTSRWSSVPYECIFSRERLTSLEQRDQDVTVILTGVHAELLYLRVADTTVFVAEKLRQLASDPPTMSRLKILCFMGKIKWDLDVKSEEKVEKAMERDSLPTPKHRRPLPLKSQTGNAPRRPFASSEPQRPVASPELRYIHKKSSGMPARNLSIEGAGGQTITITALKDGEIPFVNGKMLVDTPGSENIHIEINPQFKTTPYAGLIFTTPCVARLLTDGTMVLDRQGIRAEDESGREWISAKIVLDGEEVIALFPGEAER